MDCIKQKLIARFIREVKREPTYKELKLIKQITLELQQDLLDKINEEMIYLTIGK